MPSACHVGACSKACCDMACAPPPSRAASLCGLTLWRACHQALSNCRAAAPRATTLRAGWIIQSKPRKSSAMGTSSSPGSTGESTNVRSDCRANMAFSPAAKPCWRTHSNARAATVSARLWSRAAARVRSSSERCHSSSSSRAISKSTPSDSAIRVATLRLTTTRSYTSSMYQEGARISTPMQALDSSKAAPTCRQRTARAVRGVMGASGYMMNKL